MTTEGNILLKGAPDSDREAFNDLVRTYYESLTAFAFHILKNMEAAEDVVQDIFATLWVTRRKIDFGAPLKNYLYVATRNKTYNYIRSARRHSERIRYTFPQHEEASLFLVEEETNRILMAAIDRLPPRSAEVIRLSLDGMTQEQISQQMGITLSTVKALKSAGVRRLKQTIGAIGLIVEAILCIYH